MAGQTDRAHGRGDRCRTALATVLSAEREVQVLRLLARGLSNKDIAHCLVISPETVGNDVEHIYAKIDASTRATASLFAMRHGLPPEEEFAAAGAAA